MILTVYFVDGHHINHEIGTPNSLYHSWNVGEKTLIVSGLLKGDRIEYPLVNIRALEIITDTREKR